MSCQRSSRAVGWLKRTVNLPGDVIEMGVWRGQTTIALAKYLKNNNIKKKVYACDTFEGLPYDGKASIDPQLKKGECNASINIFWNNVVSAGLEKYVIPISGLIENTLYQQLNNKVWCFAFLDMDLYEPTSFGTKYLISRMTKGSVIGYHDYRFERCPGIQRVVDLEIDKRMFSLYPNFDSNCAFLRKIK